jgi:hypothetical protein
VVLKGSILKEDKNGFKKMGGKEISFFVQKLLLLNHVFKIVQFQFYFLICSDVTYPISNILHLNATLTFFIICQYSSTDIILQLHSYNIEGSLTYRPFEREISHPIQKRTLRLPAIKSALGREKRIPCRSSNPACHTSLLVSSDSAESVMCRPAFILPQNETYKDIGTNKNIYIGRKKETRIERKEE